jgi:transketolase
MQKAYTLALNELAEKDSNVLSLNADNGTGFDELFKRDFPNQYFDFGIAEEHLVAAAAGMAYRGKIPFVYTAGAFLAYRSYEFIRDDVCLQRQNVKLVGWGSGLALSTLGATHHTTEDIGVLRVLPGLKIFSPASPLEVRDVVFAAYKTDGPVYIRLGIGGEEEIYGETHNFDPGKCTEIQSGNDIAVFSTGSIIGEVLKAAKKLQEKNIHARIINVHTLKPMDIDMVVKAALETKMLFSVEEHNVSGGLGSILAEILSEQGSGTALKRIGLPGVFATGYGSLAEVRRANKLDSNGIYNSICKYLGEAKQ